MTLPVSDEERAQVAYNQGWIFSGGIGIGSGFRDEFPESEDHYGPAGGTNGFDHFRLELNLQPPALATFQDNRFEVRGGVHYGLERIESANVGRGRTQEWTAHVFSGSVEVRYNWSIGCLHKVKVGPPREGPPLIIDLGVDECFRAYSAVSVPVGIGLASLEYSSGREEDTDKNLFFLSPGVTLIGISQKSSDPSRPSGFAELYAGTSLMLNNPQDPHILFGVRFGMNLFGGEAPGPSRTELPSLEKNSDIEKGVPTVSNRREIVQEVQGRGGVLKKKWPDLNLDYLAKVVSSYATHVSDPSSLVEGMVAALQKQGGDSRYAYAFAAIWSIVYNFGEAHKKWVARRNQPLLPDDQVAQFVEKTLSRLEEGKIKIGVLPPDLNGLASAAYDAKSNTLQLGQKLTGATFPGLILHELYHAEQDASMEKITTIAAEVEAELLARKVAILLGGYPRALPLYEGRKQLVLEDYASQVRSAISSGKTETIPFFFMNYFADEKNFHRLLGYSSYGLEVARLELKTGLIEKEGREKFAEKYAIARLFPMIQNTIRQVEEELSRLRTEIGEDRFRRGLEEGFRSLKDLERIGNLRFLNELTTTNAGEVGIYMLHATQHLYVIYYLLGPERARAFFENQYLPALLGPAMVRAAQLNLYVTDGL